MKKHILFSILIFLGISVAKSQTFTFNTNVYTSTISCVDSAAFHFDLTNNSSSTLSLSYRVISNTLPTEAACWNYVVCDCYQCYPMNVIPDSLQCTFPISGGSTVGDFLKYEIKGTLGHYGTGTIQYLVYETGNMSNRDTITVNITAGCATGIACATGISKHTLTQLEIYPTIATDNIYIQNSGSTKNIESLLISDALGKIVKSEKNLELGANKTAINISTLPNGIYFIQLWDGDHSLTKKIIKNN